MFCAKTFGGLTLVTSLSCPDEIRRLGEVILDAGLF